MEEKKKVYNMFVRKCEGRDYFEYVSIYERVTWKWWWDFRLPLLCSWDVCSSGILCIVAWEL